MRIRVYFHGRRVGAIGIMYVLDRSWVGSGLTREECVADAARKAYLDGYEHLTPVTGEETDDAH